jgi:hypothetical protein
MLEQTVSICPGTVYTVTAYGRHENRGENCYLQICHDDNNKCGMQTRLRRNVWTEASFSFRTTGQQTSALIQVYTECLGDVMTHVNIVYLDQISIQ